MKKLLVSLLIGLPMLHAAAMGAVLFTDTFERPDGNNIEASLDGIANNTGTTFVPGDNPVGGTPVYIHGYRDTGNRYPNFNGADAVSTDGGGIQISANRLQLAYAPGTANAMINHNFVNAAITTAGGFSVSADFAGFDHTLANDHNYGVGFAVGLPASAGAPGGTGDAATGNPRMTGGIGTTIGATVPTQSLSDFWIVLRTNGTLAWGGNGGTSGTVAGITGLGTQPTGNVTVNFFFASFDQDSTVNYEVFFNGVSRGAGTFVWSGDNENYIGLDARATNGAFVDSLTVSIIPEPSAALLGLFGCFFLLCRRR